MASSSSEPKAMKGWVYKEGKRLKSRNARFLVLSGTSLSHYVREGGEPTWQIDIKEVRVSIGQRPLEFRVSAGNHHVSFFTDGFDDFRSWVQALKSETSVLEDFYNVGTRIGHGSYGEVYKGIDKMTKETRAIKVIVKNPNNRKQQRFIQRERDILTTVRHKNIVQTVDVFEGPRKLAIVTEFMKGGELFDIIITAKTFTEDNARVIMKQLLEGVQYLHSRNIVHRDIKPENILCLDKTWPLVVKLTDFGLSNFLNPEHDRERMLLSHVGTTYYIAPEIIGDGGYGPAVDIWACGVVLFIMLCGRFPFWGKTDIEYMRSLNKGIEMTGEAWDEVSDQGKQYLKDLLQMDPERRPTAAQALNHKWICTAIAPNANRRLSSVDGITEINAHNGNAPEGQGKEPGTTNTRRSKKNAASMH